MGKVYIERPFERTCFTLVEVAKMTEMVVVRSKIKELAEGMNVAGDFAEHLNEEVVSLIKRACERAKANKRSTIQARDL